MPSAEDFNNELLQMIHEAKRAGNEYMEIEAGELHRRVDRYPGRDHRMPGCCGVMRAREATEWGKVATNQPPSGHEASLRIRYRLPALSVWGYEGGFPPLILCRAGQFPIIIIETW